MYLHKPKVTIKYCFQGRPSFWGPLPLRKIMGVESQNLEFFLARDGVIQIKSFREIAIFDMVDILIFGYQPRHRRHRPASTCSCFLLTKCMAHKKVIICTWPDTIFNFKIEKTIENGLKWCVVHHIRFQYFSSKIPLAEVWNGGI